MPIDASIALRGNPVQDPTETYGKALQLKSLLNQQQMQDYAFQKAQRADEQENALNDAYRQQVGPGGQINREGLMRDLATRGLGSRIPALQKQFGEADKAKLDVTNTQSQIDERTWKGLKARTDATNAMFSSLLQNPNVTHEDVIAGLTDLVNQGLVSREEGLKAVQSLPGNPQALRPFLMQKGLEGLDAAKRLEMLTPKIITRNTGGTTDTVAVDQLTGKPTVTGSVQNTQSPESRASVAATLRGQNMADARARETTAAAVSKPFEVTGPDGLPMLVQQDKQGNITPVQGFGPKSGSAKPLNDAQAKALLFGSRMQESNKILEGLEGKYSPAAVNSKMALERAPVVGGMAGMVGNAMLSEQGQQAEQAQRDFVNAVLRRESGAVISEQEFANAQKQYFPQPNDSPGVLKQKAANRQLAIRGLLAEVPEGRRGSITTGAPAVATSGFKIISVK